MRSLIIALTIIGLIVGFSIIHAVRTASGESELIGIIEDGTLVSRTDDLCDAWERMEGLLRMTVHEERLRAVRAALIELRAAARSGRAEREIELLKEALDGAASRERFSFGQIF